jgi:hypothetical protein
MRARSETRIGERDARAPTVQTSLHNPELLRLEFWRTTLRGVPTSEESREFLSVPFIGSFVVEWHGREVYGVGKGQLWLKKSKGESAITVVRR